MPNPTEYTHIFQPIKIGPVTAKNRMEVSPAEYHMCSKEGWVTREFVEFTESLAASGAGIVTIGDSPVTQKYFEEGHFQLNMSDPMVSNGLFYVAEAIHKHGGLASLELNLRDEEHRPADFTIDEIHEMIEAFAKAAGHVKQAGFDMVMIHAGHGHVVDQFFHPYFNKRTDEYGTDTIENRCRFAREIAEAVRAAIGRDMAIEMRMSGDERLGEGLGMGIEDMALFAEYMQDYVDLLHVSSGNLYDMRAGDYMIQGQYMPRAVNVELAAYIKKRVHIPVVSVGKFNVPLAEEHIAAGDCDMVAMIRQFIADPDCLKKAHDGRADDIRPCIRCNACTGGGPGILPKPTRCGVNPRIGREHLFPHVLPATTPKRVAIVGGGAGGMEAARWLAVRGHKPIIYEKGPALGGNMVRAGENALKVDVREYAEWSIRTVLDDPRIEVRLNTEVTPELLAAEAPDAVILALGAEPIIPRIPGIDLPNVILAIEADADMSRVGNSAVVVGAGLVGSETALALTYSGHDVTMLARSGRQLKLVDMMSRETLVAAQGLNLFKAYMYCDDANIGLVEQAALKECTPEGAIVKKADGTEELLACDTIVLSLGLRPRFAEVEALRNVCHETYVIGDCNKARVINDAVREAFFAAMQI